MLSSATTQTDTDLLPLLLVFQASRHFPVASAALKSTSSLLSLSLSSARLPYRVKSPPPPLTSGGHGSGPSLPALARIPQAVGYDMETAADIDVGWLNVLVAHVWEGYRDDFLAGGSDRKVDSVFSNGNDLDEDSEWIEEEDKSSDPQRTARDLMQDALNRPKLERGKMDFMDPIQVTECQVGNSYPIFSNARVRPRDDQGRVVSLELLRRCQAMGEHLLICCSSSLPANRNGHRLRRRALPLSTDVHLDQLPTASLCRPAHLSRAAIDPLLRDIISFDHLACSQPYTFQQALPPYFAHLITSRFPAQRYLQLPRRIKSEIARHSQDSAANLGQTALEYLGASGLA